MKFDELVMLLESDEGVEVKRTYWDRAKKKLKSVEYFLNGEYHRLDGPAYQAWYEDGQKRCELWYKDGKYHRLDGPAYQAWYEDGQKRCELWYKDGKFNRLDGPAYQAWYADGQKQCELWYKDVEYHRLDGPAYQAWYADGQKQCELWYKDGKEMSKAEFDAYTKYNPEDRQTMDDLDLPDF